MGSCSRFQVLSGNKETHINDFSFLDNTLLVESLFSGGDFCFINGNKKDQKAVTINDTFNLRGLNNDEIVELIINRTGINIRNKSGIEKLNKLFLESVSFLQNVLYKNVGNDIKKKKYDYFSVEPNENGVLGNDVIKFLRETEKGKRISQTHCRIAKTIYSLNDVLENPKIVESDDNARKLIATKVVPGIQVNDGEETIGNKKTKVAGFDILMNYNIAKCTRVIDGKIINFTLKFRGKESNSALLKMVYNPEYSATELMHDPIGLELVCKNDEEAVELLNYFYLVLFEGKINEMKNKGFNLEECKDMHGLDDGFIKKMIKSSGKKKLSTNDGYKDLKIIGKVDLDDIELRVSIEGNKQSDVLKSDEIYYLSKLLLTMIRLDGHVTENYIKIIINNFFDTNPDFCDKIDNIKLYEYLTKPLILIDRGKNCKIFTSKERYNTLNNTEFYPENFKQKEV